MMTVYEYASDMNKTISEILNLCKNLDINVNSEDDMLNDDDIIFDWIRFAVYNISHSNRKIKKCI